MASNDANLGIEVESPQISKWIPEAAKPEVVARFCDVLETGINTSGVALTHALRFSILFPAMCLLGLAELLVRLDRVVESNYRKLGVQR
jgi:hypothetical protein